MAALPPLSGQQLISLKDRVVAGFNSSHWQELAALTDADQIVNGHSRLLRSLSWGDPDYDGNVLEVLKRIIKVDAGNLGIVLDYVNQKFPAKGGVSTPDPTITSDVVNRAIADAEQLLISSGATSGVDRMHTALHGYLRAVCTKAGIEFTKDASMNSLLRLLREEHPALNKPGPRRQDIDKVLRSMSAIMDALNPVRNNASVAHPNTQLLEAPEALLCINATRTILHYLQRQDFRPSKSVRVDILNRQQFAQLSTWSAFWPGFLQNAGIVLWMNVSVSIAITFDLNRTFSNGLRVLFGDRRIVSILMFQSGR